MNFNKEFNNIYRHLTNEEIEQRETSTEETKWQHFKNSMIEASKKVLPKKQKQANQSWVNNEILDKMDKRKTYKNVNKDMYRKLNKKIKRDCTFAKEKMVERKL